MTTSKNKQQIRPVILGPMGVQADSALYFVEDQVLFHGIDEYGAEQIKFVSPATLREAFAKEPVDSGWLPPGISRCGTSSRGSWMVRWHPPATYVLHLEGRKSSIKVPMPSLVWIGIRHHYYLVAAREKEFTPSAALYLAPLPNINSHGLICFGQNQHPDVSNGGFDKAWRTFWEAPFNDDHAEGKSKKHDRNINEHLLALAKGKASQYPANDLVSMNTSLNAAIERLTKRGDEWD